MDGVGTPIGGSSLRPAAAGAFFPGGSRCGCLSSELIGYIHGASVTVR